MPIPHLFNPLGRFRDSELYYLIVQPGIVTQEMSVTITGTGVISVPDWGDGYSSESVSGEEVSLSHTYETSGIYMIRIKADCSHIMMKDNPAIMEVDPDLSKLGTLTDTRLMFQNCINLAYLPNGFSIPETVTATGSMFLSCALQTVPECFRLPSNATECNQLFYGCTKLITLPDGFTVPNTVTRLISMFNGCSNLVSLPDSFQFPDALEVAQNVFMNCVSLQTLPSGFHIPDSVTKSEGMFFQCSALESDISNVFQDFSSGIKNIQQMFDGCVNVTGTIPANKLWNNSGVTWESTLLCFRGCANLTNYSEIPTGWK